MEYSLKERLMILGLIVISPALIVAYALFEGIVMFLQVFVDFPIWIATGKNPITKWYDSIN